LHELLSRDIFPLGNILSIEILELIVLQFCNGLTQDFLSDYVLDTDELYEALDGVSLQEPEVMAYIKEMVAENIR
ncbi:MAG: hypothetical protein SPL42_08180, partial [Bacteroidales bacterium]|nr:hypothetical protein [Bacteroidales bacterium]